LLHLGKAPLRQQEGAFFLVLAPPHLYPGRLRRLAQDPAKICQEALPVEVPAHFQGKITGAHHQKKEELIIIRAFIRRGGVALQEKTAGAGFLTH
jgi:hypothetical protein